jgi:hypothetical protein
MSLSFTTRLYLGDEDCAITCRERVFGAAIPDMPAQEIPADTLRVYFATLREHRPLDPHRPPRYNRGNPPDSPPHRRLRARRFCEPICWMPLPTGCN